MVLSILLVNDPVGWQSTLSVSIDCQALNSSVTILRQTLTVSLLEIWTSKGLLLISHFVIKCSLEISPHTLSTESSPLKIVKDLTT
jgi:hypothetical protein